jgi:hypothetical protein
MPWRSGANTMKKVVTLLIGVIGALLGGLWLLQGLGLVHVPPILCFADCAPIRGSSPPWAIVGLAVFTAGALTIVYSLRRHTRR